MTHPKVKLGLLAVLGTFGLSVARADYTVDQSMTLTGDLSNMMIRQLAFVLCLVSFVLSAAGARPAPRPALLERIKSGIEVYGIVHWGLNTYTDREWGYGDEDPRKLNPDSFDADQIVGACKDGGLQGLVVVAKHHDGFCLWPTKTTEHNITKSPFRGGKGNYVKEMEQACRKHGLKFGVYVSPWDRNSAAYATPKYVEIFHAQIKELLSGDYGEIFEMWFDGANGGDGWYGGKCGRRKIPADYYRFDEVFKFVRELQPNVCIFNEADGADYRWPGNERGQLVGDSAATIRSYDRKTYGSYCNRGDLKNGTTFHPPECDFPLRRGWFYHAKEKKTVRCGEFLMQRYLNTVGNGGTMNIGIAPDRHGRLAPEDVAALKRFGELKREFFARPADGTALCNVVVMTEDVSKGEYVTGWKLTDGQTVLASGTALGIKRIRVFGKPVVAKDVGRNLKLEIGFGGDREHGHAVGVKLYYVEPKTLNCVMNATTTNGETDTAQWMTAGKEQK